MNLFLDTSVLIKLYHKEQGTEKLKKFINDNSGQDLIISISEIAKAEMHSAFMKKVRLKEINLDTINSVIELLNEDFERFNIIRIDSRTIDFATELIDNYSHRINLRTLDSIQLATAIISNYTHEIDFFAASDDNLLKAAQNYFNTFNPNQ